MESMTPDCEEGAEDSSEACQITLPQRAGAAARLARPPAPPAWIVWTLRAAGIYNLVWGAAVVLFPAQPFAWLGMEPPNYPELWQCIGMVVGVYGVGYWIAAKDPARHWPIVLVGWLGKVLGPIGFLNAALAGSLPWSFGLVNVANDLVWWVPFTLILYYAWRTNSAPPDAGELSFAEATNKIRSEQGHTIGELSARAGVLLVFIRHAGCTFCREALADLAAMRPTIDSRGLRLAVVHMSGPQPGAALLAHYGLADVDHFSDPECRLFRAFDLARGTAGQVLGPAIWWRGLLALLRHGVGKLEGDGFQLGGAILVRDGKVVAAQRLQTSAERMDLGRVASAGG
jgi:hypothetical protein